MKISEIVSSIIKKVNALSNLVSVSKDFTGFENRTSSRLEYDENYNATLKILSPTVVYKRGIKYVITEDLSINIKGKVGNYVVVNTEDMKLEFIEGTPNFSEDLLCMYVVSGSPTAPVILGDERHSASVDTDWHKAQHLNVGTVWRSGGTLGIKLHDIDTSYSVSTPMVMADEDLVHIIIDGVSDDPYVQKLSDGSEIPYVYTVDGNIEQMGAIRGEFPIDPTLVYNKGGNELAAAADGSYVCYFLIATNDIYSPIKWVMGRVEHGTLEEAEKESFETLGMFSLPELVPMNKIICKVDESLQNASKCIVVRNYKITNREGSISVTYNPTDHESLNGRTKSNQHPITAITGLKDVVDSVETAKLSRADNVLKSMSIVNMIYVDGNLVRIRYGADVDANYEILEYVNGDLSTIKHFLNGQHKGTTTLGYETDGSSISLKSAVFSEV